MDDIKICGSDISIPFGKVILQSIELMMIQSAGMANGCFPEKYNQELEKYSPVRFEFLKEAKKKGTPGRLKLITQMMDQDA